MQNYPLDVQGSGGSNQAGNFSHQRVYSHHDANDLVNANGQSSTGGHMASLAGKFKKKNGRLV